MPTWLSVVVTNSAQPRMQSRKAMYIDDRSFYNKNATMTGLLWTAIALLVVVRTAPPTDAFSLSRHHARASARPLFFHQHQNPERTIALPRRRTAKPLLLSTVESSPPRSEAEAAALEREIAQKAAAVASNEKTTTTTNSNTSSLGSITITTVSLDYNANVGLLDQILSSHWGVRAVLMVVPAIYGTNFALGSSLNEALANPALTTALRMVRDVIHLLHLDVPGSHEGTHFTLYTTSSLDAGLPRGITLARTH
jgi:hypothetical protein